ncbi:BPSS1780 family membrane protein [Ralstonia sp. R-29]|uniref:BPSS1780 family membrane protein n=1 Tax=Ralstonia sp. R-29 TaxID=3404059 RepID=UPI003CF96038
MQLIEAPAKQGYVWLRQGVWLFRKNPIAFLLLTMLYTFAALTTQLLLPVLSLLLVALAPGIFVGYMSACRDTVAGKPIGPGSLLAGFRAYGKDAARGLWRLGLVHVGLCFVIVLVITTQIDADIAKAVFEGNVTPDMARQLYLLSLLGLALYLPVAMLFWFSPLLVAWHEIPVKKALFFSWIAVWRNRMPFLLYGLLFGVLMVAVPSFLEAALAAVGASTIAPALIAPYQMAVVTVLYCSIYATYRGCFNVTQAAGQTTDTTA